MSQAVLGHLHTKEFSPEPREWGPRNFWSPSMKSQDCQRRRRRDGPLRLTRGVFIGGTQLLHVIEKSADIPAVCIEICIFVLTINSIHCSVSSLKWHWAPNLQYFGMKKEYKCFRGLCGVFPIHGNFVVVANSPSGKEHPTSRASTAGSGLFQSGIHNNRPQSSSTLHWDESFFPSAFSEQGNVYLFVDQRCDSEGQFAWPAWWIEFTRY